MGIQCDPDSTGKIVNTVPLANGEERVIETIGDASDVTAIARVRNAAPGVGDYGLVTRMAGTVDASGSIIGVIGTFWQATQPISAAALPLPAGAATEATLLLIKAKTDNLDVALSTRTKPGDTQPVSGTFWQATQPVSGTFWQATQPVSISGAVAVTGTFWQATQPVSAASLPLPTGASTEATLATRLSESDFDTKTGSLTEAAPASDTASSGLNGRLQRIAQRLTSLIALLPASLGQKTMANSLAVTMASDQSTMPAVSEMRAATLHVTGTAAVNTAVTLTLPAAGAGLFHYITSIQVLKKYSVIGVAGAGPILTSTNLPGNPLWDTEHLAAPANTVTKVLEYAPTSPLKSSVANTATTIVCPLQLQTIWRVNVSYFTAA